MLKIGNTEISSIAGIDKVLAGNDVVFGRAIPAEYTRLEYISAAGQSALNTGIVIAETDRILFTMKLESLSTGSDKMIVSCKKGYTGGALWIETYGANNVWYVRFGYTSSNSAASTTVQQNGINVIELKKEHFIVNGSNFMSLQYSAMPDTPVGFGARIKEDGISIEHGFYGRFYDINILDANGNYRFRGLPVKETNGNGVGIYDLVSGQLFESITQTPFTAGPNYS